MNATSIGWTDYTWNVFSGCKKISPECAHCYAEHLSEQHRKGAEAKGKTSTAFPHGFDLTVRSHKLDEPRRLLKSKGPSLIFCESMSDIGLDDSELSEDERARLRAIGYPDMDHVRRDFFRVIESTPEHRYQILTKRPERLLWFMRYGAVPPNAWIGTTIGHAKSVERLDVLRRFRDLGARVLFVSIEPLLDATLAHNAEMIDAATWLDWMIVGGESGAHFNDPKHAGRFLVEDAYACGKCGSVFDGPNASCPRCDSERVKKKLAPKHGALNAVRDLLELKRGPDVLARANEALSRTPFLGFKGAASDGTSVRSLHRSLLDHVKDTARSTAIVEALRALEACWVPTFFKQWGGPRPDAGGREVDGRTYDELPTAPGALPVRRCALAAPTAGLARKLPVLP